MTDPGARRPVRPARRAGRVPLPRAALWVLAAATTMSIGVLVPIAAIRALVALPTALVVPGYAAALAIFGPRWRGDALGLALGALLSAALYPLLALLLYAASIRLSTASVLAATDALIAVCVGIVALRERRAGWIGAGDARPVAGRDFGAGDEPWSDWRAIGLFAALVAVVVGALALLMPVLPSPAPSPYTQFYLAGNWAHLHSIARPGTGRHLAVTIGVANRTHLPQRYLIVPRLDNVPWRGRIVHLGDGGTWSGAIGGPVPAGGCAHQLAIRLYAVGGGYRKIGELTLWTHDASVLPRACIRP